MNVLVINAGSSSLKYQLINTETEVAYAKGLCERIGNTGSNIAHKNLIKGTKTEKIADMPDHAVAMKYVIEALTDPEFGCIASMDEIDAIGHRVVHGGPYFSSSILLNDEIFEVLKSCRAFAPLHTDAHVMGINGCLAVMADKPQVLVFDTAFHQTMAPEAYFYALPYEYYEKYSIRRYGAHGTSHRFVSEEMAKILNKPIEETKIITCHIGNGSSISAVKGGKVMDTSMGLTPLAGIEMGTRCGDIDPSVVTYIMDKENLTPAEMDHIMNKKSGFLGVSGIDSDSRSLEAAIANGPSDPNYERANLAVNILCHGIKKFIGAYASIMNGVDAIVFTAGIGENNPHLREMVCENMEYLGVNFDKAANDANPHVSENTRISTADSKVAVYVLPTNEELVIARDTAAIVSAL